MNDLTARFVSALASIPAADWNALLASDYPFIKHEFLLALENSGAVGGNSGWHAHHLTFYRHDKLIAAMPCYKKDHSFGEYVFDHSWANAYFSNGLDYYPKLTLAIPFTPITGPRLIHSSSEETDEIYRLAEDALQQECREKNYSSWHLLFADDPCQKQCRESMLERKAVHFKWFNRGYQSFDEFLAAFSSRKRKNLRKERAYIKDSGIHFEVVEGDQLEDRHVEEFYLFYQMTYAKKSGHGGYLPRAFFQELSKTLAEHLVIVFAMQHEKAIAAALYFKDSDNLYGRYWGSIESVNYLHFETCYYQGIEYAIKHQLFGFDPGVQGEHKIQRGFEPRYTYSYHDLTHVGFHEAVSAFLDEERPYIAQYLSETQSLLPYKSSLAGT